MSPTKHRNANKSEQMGNSSKAKEAFTSSGEISLDALNQTKINVKVKAFKADVDLFGSVLAVAYRGTGPSAAVPEPGAALLSSAGAGIVAFSMRRRK